MTMSENTTEQATTEQANQATPCVLYTTRAEAEANKPADAPKSLRVYEVRKKALVAGYIWARGYDPGLAALARMDGYSLSTSSSAPITRETVANALANMTDEDRAILIRQFVPAPPAAAPAPRGRGSK